MRVGEKVLDLRVEQGEGEGLSFGPCDDESDWFVISQTLRSGRGDETPVRKWTRLIVWRIHRRPGRR